MAKKIVTKYQDSEKWLEAQLAKRVKELGGHALKYSSDIEIGYPDRLVLMPHGKVYWVELKSRGKKPRVIQEIRHTELRTLGFQVDIVSNEQQLDNFIKSIKTTETT